MLLENSTNMILDNNMEKNADDDVLQEMIIIKKRKSESTSMKQTTKMQSISESTRQTQEEYADGERGATMYKQEEKKRQRKGFSLKDLKEQCKNYKLKVSGTKKELEERIKNHEEKEKAARYIQAIFKGFRLRRLIRWQGPAFFKFAKICTNIEDFNTLDTLADIELCNRFSYKDSKGFYYGFDILSFAELLKNNNVTLDNYQHSEVMNPYDRSLIPVEVLYNALQLIKYYTTKVGRKLEKESQSKRKSRQTKRKNSRNNNSTDIANNANSANNENAANGQNVVVSGNTRTNTNLIHDNIVTTMFANIDSTMTYERKVEQYAIDLFQTIDELGNYTNYEWFWKLPVRKLRRYLRELSDIWNYRVILSADMKKNILPMNGNFATEFQRCSYAYNTYFHTNEQFFLQMNYTITYRNTFARNTDSNIRNMLPYGDVKRKDDVLLIMDVIWRDIEESKIYVDSSDEEREHTREGFELYKEAVILSFDKLKHMLVKYRHSILNVIHRFVTSAYNKEHRVLGTYYILGALTIVSDAAQQAMPWLYESFMVQ